jgi:aromatic ring-opening dioxygenase LigB subunit
MKEVEVFFDESSHKEYLLLQNNVEKKIKSRNKPSYEQLLKSIDSAISNLKRNPFCGDLIPQKYLTTKVISLYGTNKIFRIELVGYWRLLYTVVGEETRIIAFILEYVDHDKYNKLFNYKKK